MSDRAARDESRAATVSDYTEHELIARIQRRLAPPPDWLVVGIGDDAAVVEPERNRMEVVTVDAVVDGVHFDRAFVPPDAIGHRALAVNLSDLAAMGASPRFALLSLMLPGELPLDDFDGLAAGCVALARTHRLHLVGGNLTRTRGPLTVDLTAAGTVKRRQVLTRGGARPGDELYLTGSIGSARAGLEILRDDRANENRSDWSKTAVERYLYPQPRVRAGMLLGRNRVASACVDLSDGLADAAHRIAESSGVGIEVDEATVPIEADVRRWFAERSEDPVLSAATGGDDYELLVAVRPRGRRQLTAVIRQAGVPFTRVGVCTASPDQVTIGGRPMPPGYGHFRPVGRFRVPSDGGGR